MSRPVLMTVDDDPGASRVVARDLRRKYGSEFRVVRSATAGRPCGLGPRSYARCATPWTRAPPRRSGRSWHRLRATYPAQPDGTTWFLFRRILAVARAH